MSPSKDLEATKALRPQLINLQTPLLLASMLRDLLCAGQN